MTFLNPLTQTTSTAKIQTPLLSPHFSLKNPLHWPIKVTFPCWRKLQTEWFDWVEKLSLQHAQIWEQTGICDAILSSLSEIKPNPEIILALCEFWCPQTNTFIFPWGEATITLEDVMILAGLPVLGQPVNVPLLEDSMKLMERRLNGVRSELSKNTKRASYLAWLKYLNQGGEGIESLEHVGFLAYWLSRFVFPELNARSVGKHVFPIAVPLALGVKLALAPAVLACLYQNLTFLAQNAADCCSLKREISVSGPFWILQMWALERFPLLGSKLAKPLSLGQPRPARWDKLVLNNSLVDVRSYLMSGDGFKWRPYALDLENWRYPSFYPVNEVVLSDYAAIDDEELKSFFVCLQPQRLIGIDCAEMYYPQRVAMQLGYDQDIPTDLVNFHSLEKDKGGLFVASRFSQPRMSQRYTKWWKESMNNYWDMASIELKQEGIDRTKSTLTNDLEMPDSNCESEFISKGLEQEGSGSNQLMLTDEPGMKSDSNCEGDCLANGAVTSNPSSEILQVLVDVNQTKREHCAAKRDWKSESIVLVDLDEDEVEKLREKYGDQSSKSRKEVKRRAGGSVDRPLYISDQCRQLSKRPRPRTAGISLQNPIDVESYYL